MNALEEKGRNGRRIPRAARLGVSALLIGTLLGACELTSRTGATAPTTLAARAAPVTTPGPAAPPRENPGLAEFHRQIEPILKSNCYDCHGDGRHEAGIAFDQLKADQILRNPELWLKVLRNTRAGIMPANGNPRLTTQDQSTLDQWIKFTAFGVDPEHLDPGRVTAHRLNRLEDRNTIRDLLGVSFDTEKEFPSDDIGYGFDNIADVLNVSPLLMEKYLAAAQSVVDQAVPSTSRVMATQAATGRQFLGATAGKTGASMSYFTPAKVSHTFSIKEEGDYDVAMEEGLGSDITFTTASCTVTVSLDDQEAGQKVYPWHGTNYGSEIYPSWFETFHVHWKPGDHQVTVSLAPRNAAGATKSVVAYQIRKVAIEGPTNPAQWQHPANYAHFFPREDAPADSAARGDYARELLGAFATKAFRRPVPPASLDHLVDIAEKIYRAPGKTFEQGVAQAMVAVLASPRFLFRIEQPADAANPAAFGLVDEYALASRLSYFLWSTMPDETLMKLAAAGQLRKNLTAQVQRMVADPRADALVQNFSGQWLQSRAVLTVPLNAHDILLREDINATADDEVTPAQRAALNDETAAYFGYVMRHDRSLDDFIESNYTFLNPVLAGYYGLPATQAGGAEMHRVDLPPGDWRGGVLTMGSTLMVTSNPTRTSPVKRGKWVLENILGAPPPPPPPDIPPLEDAGKKTAARTPTMRETLATHRANPLCASCHDRMDPLGLAMENFDAFGTVRTKDLGQPIDATGRLATGESFKDVRDLKHILVTNHREEFYRCLTEKLLTYALGRGTEYYDVPAIDKIVESLDKNDGHFSSLLSGVINSAAFQEARNLSDGVPAPAPILSFNPARP